MKLELVSDEDSVSVSVDGDTFLITRENVSVNGNIMVIRRKGYEELYNSAIEIIEGKIEEASREIVEALKLAVGALGS